jgi:LysM repeat protein
MPSRKAKMRNPLSSVGAIGVWLAVACSAHGSPAEVESARVSEPAQRIHVVQPGETVWHVAGRRSVCSQAILTASGIRNPRRIRPGTRLTVPSAVCDPPAEGAPVRSVGASPEALPPVSAAPEPAETPPPEAAAPRGAPELTGLEDTLDVAEAHLRAARFEEALGEAREALRMLAVVEAYGVALPSDSATRAHLVAATVHVALADAAAARASLALALDSDPTLELPAPSTSPKVLAVLAEVRAARAFRLARRGSR